ncbi:hypothetical protein ACL02U_16870 [Streptomyces sp. MS06]|uniref:hypothetical protein n=1 Tax=Streptomyces sp. MS06 TaxID=3385974 RepID=UPI0039A22470
MTGAVLGVLAALPVPTALADGTGDPAGYAFDPHARSVAAATGTSDAARLEPGADYRGTLPHAGKTYYRLELDAGSTAYVAATAVPPPGSALSAGDGIRLSLQDADSHYCSNDTAVVGAARSARPITAWVARAVVPGRSTCQDAGTYYVVAERMRTGSPASAAPTADDPWQIELAVAAEPPLKETGATRAPEAWDSAAPAARSGEPRARPGGAGFTAATPIGQGAWSARVTPGQTLFYKVPLDWGRQLSAVAELGSAAGGGRHVAAALRLSLYNPVRAEVDDTTVAYDGSQRTAELPALPPVEYRNRYAIRQTQSALRFAGSYYLVVHLAAQVAAEVGNGPFGLVLRVRIHGTGQPSGPGYAGQPVPRDLFTVPQEDRRTALVGSAGGNTAMRALAVGGIGTGTVLLAVLGIWTVTARRRADQTRVSAQNPTA